jgi:hypothetical protein
MKTTLLKITPFLALTAFAAAQEVKPPPTSTGATAVEPAAKHATLSFSIPKGSLANAIEAVQVALEKAKQERLNVLMTTSAAPQVPELTLRNVTGPDALMLLATAAGCELKPVISTAETRGWGPAEIIGWEFRPPGGKAAANKWSQYVGDVTAQRASGLAGTGIASANNPPTATGRPGNGGNKITGIIGGSNTLQPPTGGAGDSGSGSGAGVISEGSGAGLSGVGSTTGPIAGGTGTTFAPGGVTFYDPGTGTTGSPAGNYAGADTIWVAAAPQDARSTRVYALGTVTSYMKFPDVEAAIRNVLDADGIAAKDMKLTLHDKTNVLIANGTKRGHALIDQMLQALSRDAADRDAQNNSSEMRDMKAKLEQLNRQLIEREAENQKQQELRKQMEAEMKQLLKNSPNRP